MTKEKKAKKKKEFDLDKFLIQVLRAAFRKTPMYNEAKKRAKEEFFEESKHGKPMRRVRFICASCNRRFFDKEGQREIAVDHIDPIVSVETGFTNYSEWIKRHFCLDDNGEIDVAKLQILCNYADKDMSKYGNIRSCHKTKTAAERTAAAQHRKDKKNVVVLQDS
jgi:hypothetical protein